VKSVDASNASKMFDLWVLRRDFVFTAINTSAFKTAVKGKVRMLKIILSTRAATATGEGCCSLSPMNRSASHPVELASLEFIAFSWRGGTELPPFLHKFNCRMTVFAFFMKTLVSPSNFHVLSKFFFRARDLHTFLVLYGCHLELYKGRNVDNLSIQ